MKLELFNFTQVAGWVPTLQPQMDSPQTLVLVFGSSSFDVETEVFSELHQAFPNSKIIGCSTAGEIFGAEILDNTLSVAVMHFNNTALESANVRIDSAEDSCHVGRQIAEALLKPDLKGVLVISDGMSVNGSELIRGLNQILPESVVVTGGLAGDGDRFKKTWVMKDWKPQTGYVTAVGYYGDAVQLKHGSKGGWSRFGPKRLVTKSKSNVLYEIDGKPALALYKEYLGERASGLPATALLFPLSLLSDAKNMTYIVRTVLSVDEDNQSMTFAGDIPEGHQVQLMRADFDSLIDGACDAASLVKADENSCGDMLNIAISCVGRRLVLGERCEEEVEAVLESLPPGTKQLGFYSYGEISPYVTGQACQLHNQTMTITTITETG